jgi:cytochrome c oxidase assembly factor CtaG
MVVLLAILSWGYFRRVASLAGDPRRRVPWWRQFSFGASIFVLLVEPITPLGAWDDRSFTVHMIEHLLIGDLAALLMVLGLTGPLIQPLMRNPVIAFVRPLAEPVPALVLWIGNLYFWHLPFAMEAAITHDTVHVIQHMCFFGAGFNVWMTVFGPLPQPAWFGNIAKLIYLVLQRMAGVLLGNFFIFAGSVVYEPYIDAVNPFGMTALGDQSTAGAIMMAEGSIISFILLGWLFFKAASESEESEQLIQYGQQHGVEVSRERSDRAAAAGTGELLRQRIESSAGSDAASDATREARSSSDS